MSDLPGLENFFPELGRTLMLDAFDVLSLNTADGRVLKSGLHWSIMHWIILNISGVGGS